MNVFRGLKLVSNLEAQLKIILNIKNTNYKTNFKVKNIFSNLKNIFSLNKFQLKANLNSNININFIFNLIYNLVCSILVIFFVGACASSTERGDVGLDRKQFLVVSSAEIESKSAEAYEEVKAEAKKNNTLDTNQAQYQRVLNISKRLLPHVSIFRADAANWNWETHVIKSEELNAYCMPGGKIMFYSGIIDTLKMTDAEIAAVMGHEVAHALREHGRERMSEEMIKMGLLQFGVQTGMVKEQYAGALLALSTVFVSLPHGRNQESEADVIGLEIMARAGYNPQEAVTLWKKMLSAGGGNKPPEFMSTHPSEENRIKNIESYLSKVMPLYLKAKQ